MKSLYFPHSKEFYGKNGVDALILKRVRLTFITQCVDFTGNQDACSNSAVLEKVKDK